MELPSNNLILRSVGIDTYRENIIYLHADCHICKAEGYSALTRLVVKINGNSIIATLNVVYSDIIKSGEAGLSMEAMKRLNAKDGDEVTVNHLKVIESLSFVRAKMYGRELSQLAFDEIISDVVSGHYSNIEMAAFISACAGDNLSVKEITCLTKSMIGVSEKITWDTSPVLDKHCVGGLPGNRTTPIVVSILSAAGFTIPKTSSRAITSPAGTADAMETVTPVHLSLDEIKDVVKKEGGCLAWGGAVKLSPADDILISVTRALDMDSEGQMIASVLSKKIAAGSTTVLVDIPVGSTAKVRSQEQALKLQYYFKAVAETIGLNLDIVITDGSQPVGRGIGPALEMVDVLSVLRNEKDCPPDLRDRSLMLASRLLEISGKYTTAEAIAGAKLILESGQAYKKFMAICEAQGGFTEPEAAKHSFEIKSKKAGIVKSVDNRKLSRIAKLAGAPKSKSAGLRFLAPIGTQIKEEDTLFVVYTEAAGELEYVINYIRTINDLIIIE